MYSPFGSLSKLDRVGLLDRELEYLKRLCDDYENVYIVDPYYSANVDSKLPLNSIYLTFKVSKHFAIISYMLLSPFIFRFYFANSEIVRVRNVSGGLPAVIAKLFYNIDYVIGYQWSYAGLTRIHKKRLISFFANIYEHISLKRALAVFPSTESLENKVKSWYPNAECVIIPNYVDTHVFVPGFPRSIQNNTINILAVGRLHEDKNYMLLLDAINHSKVKCVLTIIGNGHLKDNVKNRCVLERIDLILHEKVSYSDMPKYYQNADIFALTSKSEGHPKALIEAMSCGLSPVVTNVDGNRDIISDGYNGIICDQKANVIGNAISKLSTDENLRTKISKNARCYVLNNCSMEAVIEKELKYLKSINIKCSTSNKNSMT